jgi:hypothetical protein
MMWKEAIFSYLSIQRCCTICEFEIVPYKKIRSLPWWPEFEIIRINKLMCIVYLLISYLRSSRSQRPRGLRRRSTAERLLGSWVRIPRGAWMFVFRAMVVLSGRGLCDGPIPRPEESYRLWCVIECDRVKIKTLYTYCEQVGRRGKHYEKKRNLRIMFKSTDTLQCLYNFAKPPSHKISHI